MNYDGYPPIVYFLPEDKADEQIINGFNHSLPRGARTKVLPFDHGYGKVRSTFEKKHVADMRRPKNRSRYMVLVVDFDQSDDRFEYMRKAIPDDLRDRVFVLGAWSNPEKLKVLLESFEKIGELLAKDCLESTNDTWGHELLRHNAVELERMKPVIRDILFPNS